MTTTAPLSWAARFAAAKPATATPAPAAANSSAPSASSTSITDSNPHPTPSAVPPSSVSLSSSSSSSAAIPSLSVSSADSSSNKLAVDPFNAVPDESSISHLILDTGAFVGQASLANFPNASSMEFLVLNEIETEIKDLRARQSFQTFPFPLIKQSIEKESLDWVKKFAKKTGDLYQLSEIDLKFAALAYQWERKMNGMKYLKTEPVIVNDTNTIIESKQSTGSAPSTNRSSTGSVVMESWSKAFPLASSTPLDLSDLYLMDNQKFNAKYGIVHEENHSKDEEKKGENDDENKEDGEEGESEEEEEDDDDNDNNTNIDDDGEGEWITSENLHQQTQYKKDVTNLSANRNTAVFGDLSNAQSSVAAVTTDFALQNLLLSMGIRLVSLNGLAIRSLRQFLLKCYSCYRFTREVWREFCPHCGNHTLIRISAVMGNDGILHYKKTHRTPSTRGTKYAVPLPKGGRKNNDLILSEDVLYNMNKIRDNRRFKKNGDGDGFGGQMEFGWEQVGKKGQTYGGRNVYAYGNKNPNEGKKKATKRKKARR